MDVIAEGVETEAQRSFLEGHGCLAYQGYLFSKPLPLDEFIAFARQNLPEINDDKIMVAKVGEFFECWHFR